jgi:hypothetical protein
VLINTSSTQKCNTVVLPAGKAKEHGSKVHSICDDLLGGQLVTLISSVQAHQGVDLMQQDDLDMNINPRDDAGLRKEDKPLSHPLTAPNPPLIAPNPTPSQANPPASKDSPPLDNNTHVSSDRGTRASA